MDDLDLLSRPEDDEPDEVSADVDAILDGAPSPLSSALRADFNSMVMPWDDGIEPISIDELMSVGR